jgi:predicted TIM-barrel fold metal-dependent hydrolase
MTVATPILGCDTHVHVFGPQAAYPMLADRHYTSPPASVADLQAHLRGQGLSRVVLVQASVYGYDNSCLLDGLDQLQGQGRGVVVINEATTSVQLQQMHQRGARGARINQESVATRDASRLQAALGPLAAQVASLGWHIQVFAQLPVVAACAPLIRQLHQQYGLHVVLDHFALWRDPSFTDPDALQVLSLLQDGMVYIKLSGSYRVPLPTRQAFLAVAQRFVDTRADRLLWASDWPHTNRTPGLAAHEVSAYRVIAPDDLRAERDAWLPSASLQQQVLEDNPARLYGF